jgi:hypothetical protein
LVKSGSRANCRGATSRQRSRRCDMESLPQAIVHYCVFPEAPSALYHQMKQHFHARTNAHSTQG